MTNVPVSHIQLELAREPGHPLGDRDHRYHLYLPLRGDGCIDVETFRDNHARCRVRRFRPGEDEAHGQIVHGPGGRWFLRYPEDTGAEHEVGFRLGEERFVTGEYVSIREDDGKMHTLQVISVKAA
jgi:hypothetical protein